jgi:hypothetical protein
MEGVTVDYLSGPSGLKEEDRRAKSREENVRTKRKVTVLQQGVANHRSGL